MKLNEVYLPEIVDPLQVMSFMAKSSNWTLPEEVVDGLGFKTSKVNDIFDELRQKNLVFGAPETGYKLSLRVYGLGQEALRQAIDENVRREMLRTVDNVVAESNETSFFGILSNSHVPYYVAKRLPPQSGTDSYDVGGPIPLQSTAIGKALLAWRDEKTVRALIAKNPSSESSDRAILDPDAFMKHLETIRAHGFSLNNCENPEGIVSVAAPVFKKGKKHPIAGVSIVSTPEKMYSGFFHKAGECVHAAAKAMSEKLGAKEYPAYKPMTIPTH